MIRDLADKLNSLSVKNISLSWIVVDDGSKDEPFKEFPRLNKIKTVLLSKENGGKHRAVNMALDYMESEVKDKGGEHFVLILDSDDYLNQRQFNNIINVIKCLSPDVDGVIGKNINEEGEDISLLKKGVVDKNYIFKIKGDCSRVVRLSKMLQYRFDAFEGECFTTEINYWAKIHSGSVFVVSDYEFVTVNYQSNGLSSKYVSLCRSNPKGIIKTIECLFELKYDFLSIFKFCVFHISCLSKPYKDLFSVCHIAASKKLMLLLFVFFYKRFFGFLE